MTKLKGIAAAALAMILSPAQAQSAGLPPQVGATLGNTLHYRTADGALEMFILDRDDGSYEAMVMPRGAPTMHTHGNWQVDGATLCRTQAMPTPPPDRARICEPYASYPALGETATMMNGVMQVTLLEGRVGFSE